jgi:hypothetical protein
LLSVPATSAVTVVVTRPAAGSASALTTKTAPSDRVTSVLAGTGSVPVALKATVITALVAALMYTPFSTPPRQRLIAGSEGHRLAGRIIDMIVQPIRQASLHIARDAQVGVAQQGIDARQVRGDVGCYLRTQTGQVGRL